MTLTTLTDQLQKAAITYSEQQLGSFMNPENGGLSLEDIILRDIKEVDEAIFTGSGLYGQTRNLTVIFRNGRTDRATRKKVGNIVGQVQVEIRFRMWADKTWQANVELSV